MEPLDEQGAEIIFQMAFKTGATQKKVTIPKIISPYLRGSDCS